jgi:phospholipase C
VPSGASEHPPGSIQAGERFVRGLLNGLAGSSAWSSSAFTWTYDDWGGWYDHVKPPQVDRFGYGFRAPALLVSAYAKRGEVVHTQLDFTSILRFIEDNWNLEPLAERDANANSIADGLDFAGSPRPAEFIPAERAPRGTPDAAKRPVIYGAYGIALLFAGALLGFSGRLASGWTVPRRLRSRHPGTNT